MVLREYWVLKESRIPLKPVLGGINRLNETESAVFIFCRLSLFLQDPFSPRLFKYFASDIYWKFGSFSENFYFVEGHICHAKLS